MSIKSDFECSYCFKVVKYPRMLSCGDNICDEHLTDSHVLSSNEIVCKNCKKKFENNKQVSTGFYDLLSSISNALISTVYFSLHV